MGVNVNFDNFDIEKKTEKKVTIDKVKSSALKGIGYHINKCVVVYNNDKIYECIMDNEQYQELKNAESIGKALRKHKFVSSELTNEKIEYKGEK